MKSRKWIVKPKAPTADNVFDVYAEEYEKRYRTKLKSAEKTEVRRDLEIVTGRLGVTDAIRAVRIMFGPKMKWFMSRNKASFIATKDTFERHILDLLQEPEVMTGESGQWRGDQTDQAGSQKAW